MGAPEFLMLTAGMSAGSSILGGISQYQAAQVSAAASRLQGQTAASSANLTAETATASADLTERSQNAAAGLQERAAEIQAAGIRISAAGQAEGFEREAEKLDRAAKAGRVSADQTDAALRAELRTTLGNIQAVVVAAGGDPDSPTALAIMDNEAAIAERNRQTAFANQRAQAGLSESDAAFFRNAATLALKYGEIGAAGQQLNALGARLSAASAIAGSRLSASGTVAAARITAGGALHGAGLAAEGAKAGGRAALFGSVAGAASTAASASSAWRK